MANKKISALDAQVTPTNADFTVIVHDPLGTPATEKVTISNLSKAIDLDNVPDGTTNKVYTATEETKLAGIEEAATADQTGAEIKVAYEAEADTNAFTDAEQTKLTGIDESANNYTHPNHSGDVTSSGDGATTIANDAVTYAKIQDVSATSRVLGRIAAGSGVVEELTGANIRTIANVEDGADVTDTDNVTSAGALMDSEVTNLAAVKAFDPADYATALGEDDNYVTDAEKSALHPAVTVTDSSEIDFTLTGQEITASLVASSVDETKLDASVNSSLDLADSAIQTETDPLSLHLDQTTPQTITNDVPLLSEGRVLDEAHQFVDKQYVDTAVSNLGIKYYMLSTGSGVTQPVTSEEYYNTSVTPSEEVESSITATDPADDEFIAGWISPTDSTPTKLIKGVYDWDIFVAKSASGNKNFRVYWRLVEYKSGGTETVIATSANSNLLDVKALRVVPLTLDSDYTPDAGSRIVGKVYAKFVDGSSATDIILYSEGASDSHWEIPTNKEILDTLYQASDSGLDDISALAVTDGNFIVGNGTNWVAESGATARTSLNVDEAGTDNSTDVTLAGTPDYITITDQTITRNQIDLTADVTGVLPDANVANDISLTNITQITNRSHTDLSDIGTNTHTQIDSHISSTSNPHSVSASDVGAIANVVEDTTPQLGGDLETNQKNITQIATLTTDNSAQGDIVTDIVAGESLAFGNIVYLKSDGKWWKATNTAIATTGLIGFVLESKSADEATKVLLRGFVRDDDYALTVGGVIYLGASGAITQTAPSTEDYVIQVLGYALHADRLYFNPSYDRIEYTA